MYTVGDIAGRLDETVNRVFLEFQAEEGIDDGLIPPLTAHRIEEATLALANAVAEGLDWQQRNAPRVVFRQTYAPNTDTTFIFRDTYVWNELARREVVGFYAGEPTAENLETYKTAGTVAEY